MTTVPMPVNEPVRDYAPGTPERASLLATLDDLVAQGPWELQGDFGHGPRMGSGPAFELRNPGDHDHVLGTGRMSGTQDVADAVEAGQAVAGDWGSTSLEDRAAVLLRAAELAAGPWRDRLNAATMLGQGKTVQQAEIDAACELVDFLRFNVDFARQVEQVQPLSAPGVWNRVDARPLEGFVYAITPFNFTAIAANLPTAPALMGNVVLWKPSPTKHYSAQVTMELLRAAGMPPGVVTLVPGWGPEVSEVALADPRLAGIHFTGSTGTFQSLWRQVGERIQSYRTYPRLVGETGGKDFVLAHPSADPEVLRTALVRGAYEYSGQKCSAASRAYVPRSLWRRLAGDLTEQVSSLSVGDVRDFSHFTSAVIDRRAFTRLAAVFDRLRDSPGVEVLAGGTVDDSVGWYVRPTLVRAQDPHHDLFRTEYFGPLLAVYVYEDGQFEDVCRLVDSTAAYALTGAIIATDRAAIRRASEILRHAAGNLYVNDKPTGAVVGQQPFGGGRASGTNDKAGSLWNIARWTSPRAIKETLAPATDHRYPHMDEDPPPMA